MSILPFEGVRTDEGSGVRIKAAARAELFNIVGAGELFKPLDAVKWLCRDLRIAPGAPSLFGGYGYSGKSIGLQSFGLSVAAGLPVWGSMTCSCGHVLHLDYEQGFRITAGRYQRLANHLGIDPRSLQGALECGILPTAPLTYDDLCWMGDGRMMVIIDAWRSAHPWADENSSEVRKTLDAMGVASEKTGCCFCCLHHARKPNKDSPGGEQMALRGSSGFFDGSQTVYLFDGTEVGKPRVTLSKDRIGGQELPPFQLVIEDTNGGAGLSVVRVDIEEAAKQTGAEKFDALLGLILQGVANRPGVSASALADILEKRKSSVLAAVQSLVSAGELIQSGHKLYRKGYVNGSVVPF